MVVCTPYTYMNRYIDFVITIGEGMKDLMISYLDKMKSLIDLVLYLGTQLSEKERLRNHKERFRP